MGKKLLIYLIQVFLFLVMNFYLAHAETVILKNGKTIEGKIIEKTDQYIKIEIEGLPQSYFVDEIDRIENQSVDTHGDSTAVVKESYAGADADIAQADISDTIRSFFQHRFDFSPKRCVRSLSKDCVVYESIGGVKKTTMSYKALMANILKRSKIMRLSVFEDFKVNKLNIKGEEAEAEVSFVRKLEYIGKDTPPPLPEFKQPVITAWAVVLKKEDGIWKITSLERLSS